MLTSYSVAYGQTAIGQLQFSGQADFAGAGKAAVPLVDLGGEVAETLANPIDFPAIESAIVDGDRVALAVDPSVPRLADVLAAVISYLQQRGVQSSQLTIVMAGHSDRDVSQLAAHLPEDVAVEVHDPDDQTKVAYVAANKQGEPIYMNRTLVDADVVIPIMCARGRGAIDYEGAYGVFPLLTDRRTRGQFFSLRQLADPSEHKRLTDWADEAAWWVGLLVAIQVVPAPGGGIARILAGAPQRLEAAVQELMSAMWQTVLSQTYECVIALIDGGQGQQNWDSVARVLASASPLVATEGALIICSELAERPGRALHRLGRASEQSEEKLARQLSSDTADDALAAAVLLESLENCHVYLLSRLPSELVESLGVGALENLHQAEHILQQRRNCLIISSAQHALFSHQRHQHK